jgi:hypothetical protein
MLERRQQAMDLAFVWRGEEEEYKGVPVERDRLHYSFIWDRYGEQEIDQQAMLDAGIRIDPTNKNLNLKEEIKKLV